jgi:6,7-dimethyl-8-ribityllumazine synthase
MARPADAPRSDPRQDSGAGIGSGVRIEFGVRIGAVVSTYHGELTGAMLESARAELVAAGLSPADLLVVEVPGSFEIPVVARALGLREDVSAVMCFGLVLKGETPHDRYIADSVAHALQRVSLDTDKPILFGVLTCDTLEQARERALPSSGRDKGREVARAAIEAIRALSQAAVVGEKLRRAGFGGFGPGSDSAGGAP